MQLSSLICFCKGKPNSPRALTGVWTYCHDVRIDAKLSCSKLFDTDGYPDNISTSFEWMLLTNERPDAILIHLDGNMGSEFYELESAQNLPCSFK
jgi:hypothetical protein